MAMAHSSNLITLCFVALTIIACLIYSNPVQHLPHRRRKTHHTSSNTGSNDSYAALMSGCDGPEEDIVKDEYQVFLLKGHSLDQHKTFVGKAVGFDSAIRSIFNVDSETARHGLLYRAWLDEDALAAVRADIGVDLVICDVRIYPD